MKVFSVKLSLAFFMVLIFAAGNPAQETPSACALPAPPRLQNLALGMTAAEAQSALGGAFGIKVKADGDRTFFQNYIGKKPPASLSGVRALYLRFFDGRIYQIEIFYEESAAAPTLEAFAAKLAAALDFPAAAWRFAKNKAALECGAFTLVADKPLNPRVELTDPVKLGQARASRKKNV